MGKSSKIDFKLATDTFKYDRAGQIVYQTFAGHQPAMPFLVPLDPSETAQPASEVAVYAQTLERHLDAFDSCDLEKIMADYHPSAVLQMPDSTLHGADAIRDMFSGFFTVKPPGSLIEMRKKETVRTCDGGSGSYIEYRHKVSEEMDFKLA